MKTKFFLVIIIMFFLVGCQEQDKTGVFYLNHDEGTITIEGEIDDQVILPELMKNDFLFLGWTDGDNNYLGLTDVWQNETTLTAEYVAIEDVFDRVTVRLNQVVLGNYLGDSKIIGVPEYWHGYPIVGFEHNETILEAETLYLPKNLFINRTFEYFENLKDLVIYGDLNTNRLSRYIDKDLERFQEECPALNIDSFNDENPQYFEGCPIIYVNRDEDSTLYVPEDDQYLYAYDVVYKVTETEIFHTNMGLPKSIEFLKLASLSDYSKVMMALRGSELQYLGNVDELLVSEDGFYYYEDSNGDNILLYIMSEEDVITVDLDQYTFSPYFSVNANVKVINIINEDDEFISIDGVIYTIQEGIFLSTENTERYLGLAMIPPAYGGYFEMPDDLISINATQYFNIRTVKLNNNYHDILTILRYFPNVEEIIVDEENPYYTLENNILYSKNKEHVYFINHSFNIDSITLDNDVVSFLRQFFYYGRIDHYDEIEHIHLGENIQPNVKDTLLVLKSLQSITVDSDNPNFTFEDGVLMSKDKSEILYFDASATKLTVTGFNTELPNKRENNNITEIIIEAGGSIDNISVLDNYPNLQAITVDEDNLHYKMKDEVLYNKDETSLIYIPLSSSLSTLMIDENVEYIDEITNRNYPYLEEIIVSENNQDYASIDGVLYDKNLKTLLIYPLNRQSNHLNLPETVSFVRHLPANVTSIYIGQDYQFKYEVYNPYGYIGSTDIVLGKFDQFSNVQINENNRYYHQEGFITSLNGDVLYQVLPDTTEITITESMWRIRAHAFTNAPSLEVINIEDGVKGMPASVFQLENLRIINIESLSVLEMIHLQYDSVDIEGWSDYIYYFDWKSLESIHVPESMVEEYKNHEFWSFYEEIITSSD